MEPYYKDDYATIYHGDCREILPELGRFDLLLTDPPYGINHKSNGQWFLDAEPIKNDADISVAMEVLEALNDVCQVVFFSPFQPLPIDWRSVLCWHKGKDFGIGGDRETCFMRDFEQIGIRNNPPLAGKRDSSVLFFRGVKSKRHFCEKPVPLISYLLRKIPSQIVLDPFMGSGTTLVAAKLAGIKSVGIEISERYCEAAANRLRQGVLPFDDPAETTQPPKQLDF